MNEWIPCSERLPEYSDDVIITNCAHEIEIGTYFAGKWHIQGEVDDDIVVAWQYAPEPYEF